MIELTEEIMSDVFTKYHIKGLPFDAVLHRFTAPDKGDPHDHPFGFTSFILKGSYVERDYQIMDGKCYVGYVHHKEGSVHRVEAKDIHQIVELPEGECWTLIIPEKWEREPGFYKFTNEGVFYRQWNEEDFKQYE